MHAQTQQTQSLGNVNVNNNFNNPNMNMNMMGHMQQQQQEVIYAFGEMEDVQGVVNFCLPPGKKFDHLGIKVQLLGRVEMVRDGMLLLLLIIILTFLVLASKPYCAVHFILFVLDKKT